MGRPSRPRSSARRSDPAVRETSWTRAARTASRRTQTPNERAEARLPRGVIGRRQGRSHENTAPMPGSDIVCPSASKANPPDET